MNILAEVKSFSLQIGDSICSLNKTQTRMMIHGKSQIFFQMFLQISSTPDFEQSFRVKRCGLYAGVYSNLFDAMLWLGFLFLSFHPVIVP